MTRVRLRDAIIAAVAYADIFEQPLTGEELRTWLVFHRSLKRPRLFRLKHTRVDGVGYYGLGALRQMVATRQRRIAWSKKKTLLVKRIARWFQFVPSIQLVGVTGALAMNNAKKEDDIDLFFITKKGTMWMTRLFVTVISELLGVRRRPGDTKVSNKVCLNMFMAEDRLAIPTKERDLFAAHEVLQMVPLWERGGAYQKFLRANRWVRKFLPNAWDEAHQKLRANKTYKIIRPLNFVGLLQLLEPFARAVQLWYMKRRRTTEVVFHQMIRFHPVDARVWIKRAMEQRLSKFNIPLDKVFYGR